MAGFSLLAVTFIMKVVAVLFVVCSMLLVLIVLIQKGKGGGLSAAFTGGAAGGILGAKTKEPLTWFTIFLVLIFLTLAVVLAKHYKPDIGDYGSGQPVRQQQPYDETQSETDEAEGQVDMNMLEG